MHRARCGLDQKIQHRMVSMMTTKNLSHCRSTMFHLHIAQEHTMHTIKLVRLKSTCNLQQRTSPEAIIMTLIKIHQIDK